MPDLSVAEAARLIGVSRARVYQRISGNAGSWDAGRPIEVVIRAAVSRGVKNGRQLRVDVETALTWRAEREAAGLPVGPVPPALADYVIPVPPPPPAIIPLSAVGLPTVTPF